jgi:hypothetical protein
MPDQATQDATEQAFVPYTVDIRSRIQHEVLHTAIGLYSKSLEGLAKKMDANGVDKTSVVTLLAVCDDTASILDGQYTLFNAMVDDRQMASDTVDMFAGADDYNEDED